MTKDLNISSRKARLEFARQNAKDPDMKRIENDVTFNYSRSEFKFEEQPKTSSN